MRKHLYSIAVTAFCALFLTACFDESGLEKVFDGPAQVEFDYGDQPLVKSYLYNPPTVTSATDELRINLIGPHQNQAVNVQWEFVASESSAIEGVHFRFATTSRTATIPANSSYGYVPVEILLENFEVGEEFTVVLRITGADVPVAQNLNKLRFTFSKSCPSELAGKYSSLMSGRYGSGGSATYTALTSEVTLTVRPSGGYTINDMSFGVYDQLYDDASPAGVINDNCNTITLSGTDQYGDPFTGTGSVNQETGIITISWNNTWGDRGTGTLTPVVE